MQTQRLLILTIAVLLLAEAASAQTVSPQPVDDAPAGAGRPPHSQDIPVKIAKWSEAKDGLRIGLHIVSGDWSVGGKVRAEVWLHNAGGKDLTFLTSSPNRQGSGVAMSAIGADRREIRAEFINELISERLRHCTLPAGVEALKAVGVTEFSFSEARVGDGRYRVANRQAG